MGHNIYLLQGLLKNGIIVRELNNFGLKEYFRVSIGTDTEIKEFLKTLEKILKKSNEI